MLIIANFTSLLEVAIAVNAVLFIFSIGPYIEKNISREMERLHKDRDKITYPVGFVSGLIYGSAKGILSKISIIFSLISIVLLFISGIWPGASLSWYILIPLLLVLIFTVPLGSYVAYIFARSPIEIADEEIVEYYDRKIEKELREKRREDV